MENEIWKPYVVTPTDIFFPILQQVLKQVGPDKKAVNVGVVNKERSAKLKTEIKDVYHLDLQWEEDGSVCGVDVSKQIIV